MRRTYAVVGSSTAYTLAAAMAAIPSSAEACIKSRYITRRESWSRAVTKTREHLTRALGG
jgi:hypothetical protein